jgi:hypothetical protein
MEGGAHPRIDPATDRLKNALAQLGSVHGIGDRLFGGPRPRIRPSAAGVDKVYIMNAINVRRTKR